MRIKNIIFDFDGTLADTASLIVATMQSCMRDLNLPVRSEEECRSTIGMRLEEIPSRLWPDISNIGERYSQTYRKNFDELKKTFVLECFPGVTETLKRLNAEGYNLAIATSRNRQSLKELLASLGIGDCFHALVAGDDVTEGKPSPEPVLRILLQMGWKPDATLVVGDMDVDILMGKSAGCHTCGVTYGNGSPQELTDAGADKVVENICEIG